MNTVNAPIVLFAYNRPMHTKNVLDSLSKNEEAKESELFIFCDGAKENATDEVISKIEEVRNIVKKENRFKNVTIKIQLKNKGLANSIIDGVTDVINKYGTAIILEDDLIVSPYFLNYMNQSLALYQDDKNVGEIGACNFFANGKDYPNHFFTTMPDTWGWATWKDRWEKFNPDAIFLYKELEKNNLMHTFNTYGSYDMKGMLLDQIVGKVDSWAIRWQAVMILNKWLCLYSNPAYSNHLESIDATHAPVNILPPMQLEKTFITKVKIEESEDDKTTQAMMLAYSGKGDYFGKLKPKLLKRKRKNIIKRILLFPIPFGIVMLFKKNKE